MKLFWSTALILGLILGSLAYISKHDSLQGKKISASQKGQCDLSSPREALRSFLASMHRYNQDGYSGFECIVRAIKSPEERAGDLDKTKVMQRARNSLLFLENLSFDLDQDVPGEANGNSVSFPLNFEGEAVEISMNKGVDGWYISPSMFTDPFFKARIKKLNEMYNKFTTRGTGVDTFIQSLMSPYRTFFTLKSGIEGGNHDGLDTAIQTLDLSEFTPLERPVYGPMIAVMLYRIIIEYSTLRLEELSSNPKCPDTPVFLVLPGLGSITMHVVTEEDGDKAWKFTPHSLTVAQKSYDGIMQELLKEGIDPLIGIQLPLHTRIDDFIQRNYPGLLTKYWDTNLYKWLVMFAIFLFTPAVVRIVRFAVNKILDMVASRMPETANPLNRRGFVWLAEAIVVGLLWLDAIVVLVLYQELMMISLYGIKILVTLAEVGIMIMVVNLFSEVLAARSPASIRATMMLISAQILKIVIILMGLVHIANLFGQDSTRILTAMGIGGLALALAGKDTLENIFGTLVIMATRPFAVGDNISIGGMNGIVEKVGVRSTSIRTFHNSEMIVPNVKFITTPVDNLGRREMRRYKTYIGVAYNTPLENLNGYVQGLRQLVLNHPKTNKTNFQIVANNFGPSSIDILVYIFFKTKDWDKELSYRHEFIVDALRLAEELKITIAFPTNTVYLRHEDNEVYQEYQSDSHAEHVGKEAANTIRPTKTK